MLARFPNWATRELNSFLIARAHMPFTWGENDCALFVADAVLSFTGIDIAEDFRGYKDEAGAWAALRQVTGAAADAEVTVEAAAEYASRKHGLQEWFYPRFAQRGDICSFEESGRLILGLIHLSGQICSPGERGLKRFEITHVRRAWHV